MHTALSREVVINISGVVKTPVDKMAVEAMKCWRNYFKDNFSLFVELFYGQFASKQNVHHVNILLMLMILSAS